MLQEVLNNWHGTSRQKSGCYWLSVDGDLLSRRMTGTNNFARGLICEGRKILIKGVGGRREVWKRVCGVLLVTKSPLNEDDDAMTR